MEIASIILGLEASSLLLMAIVSVLLIIREVREARQKPPPN